MELSIKARLLLFSILIMLTFLVSSFFLFLGIDFSIFFKKIGLALISKSMQFLFTKLGCSSLYGVVFSTFLFLITTANLTYVHYMMGGSGPNSDSWTEDSFEMRVLLEPFSETEMEGTSGNSSIPRVARDEAGPSHPPTGISRNLSLESSLRNRIVRLENEGSIFLLEKEKKAYWNDIQTALDQAPSQKEYNRLLEFENRDLEIRERKHSCYSLFQEVLSRYPGLFDNSSYKNPDEAILTFFEDTREELEAEEVLSPADTDKAEIEIYKKIVKDIAKKKKESYYVKKILGSF